MPYIPPKYSDDMPQRVERLCREKGLTKTDLSVAFGVRVETISRWMRSHPEFAAAYQRGRDIFDTERVERSLFERAVGYEVSDKVYERRPVLDAQGNPLLVWDPDTDAMIARTDMVLIKETKKWVADTNAMIFWLKCRDPKRWQDKHVVDIGVHEDALQTLMKLDSNE